MTALGVSPGALPLFECFFFLLHGIECENVHMSVSEKIM